LTPKFHRSTSNPGRKGAQGSQDVPAKTQKSFFKPETPRGPGLVTDVNELSFVDIKIGSHFRFTSQKTAGLKSSENVVSQPQEFSQTFEHPMKHPDPNPDSPKINLNISYLMKKDYTEENFIPLDRPPDDELKQKNLKYDVEMDFRRGKPVCRERDPAIVLHGRNKGQIMLRNRFPEDFMRHHQRDRGDFQGEHLQNHKNFVKMLGRHQDLFQKGVNRRRDLTVYYPAEAQEDAIEPSKPAKEQESLADNIELESGKPKDYFESLLKNGNAKGKLRIGLNDDRVIDGYM
jgi:hypothetical protein